MYTERITYSKRLEGISAKSRTTLVPEKCWNSWRTGHKVKIMPNKDDINQNRINHVLFLKAVNGEHVQTHEKVFQHRNGGVAQMQNLARKNCKRVQLSADNQENFFYQQKIRIRPTIINFGTDQTLQVRVLKPCQGLRERG